MHKITDISMERDVLAENRHLAEHNLEHVHAHGTLAVDFMGSIGAGKTALIIELAKRLQLRGKSVAVLAGDVTGMDDFLRFKENGIAAVNVNTGNECHLDAHLVEHALEKIELDDIDVLFIENVGNLVCPADFPLGTDRRAVIISITEGDDMIRKHPMIFLAADVAVVNKVDLEQYLDVDISILERDLTRIRKGERLHRVSAKSGEGLDELIDALGL